MNAIFNTTIRRMNACLCFWCVLWGIFWLLFVVTGLLLTEVFHLKLEGGWAIIGFSAAMLILAGSAAIPVAKAWWRRTQANKNAFHLMVFVPLLVIGFWLTPKPFSYVVF